MAEGRASIGRGWRRQLRAVGRRAGRCPGPSFVSGALQRASAGRGRRQTHRSSWRVAPVPQREREEAFSGAADLGGDGAASSDALGVGRARASTLPIAVEQGREVGNFSTECGECENRALAVLRWAPDHRKMAPSKRLRAHFSRALSRNLFDHPIRCDFDFSLQAVIREAPAE